MIILINTSQGDCMVTLVIDGKRKDYEWKSDMKLAKELLNYVDNLLKAHGKNWSDIKGIGAYEGPGSFTGIRIGLTVMNTLADSLGIPIVGARGDDWQAETLKKLNSGKDEKIVLPFYNRGANITIPRK